MAIQELRMAVCDECGAMESMPPPESSNTEVTMVMVPTDWLLIYAETPKIYCPACKWLHNQ
jgi:hypothetical protein